jgi:hypothetical protein
VPVTLNLFLALELVFTFGITVTFLYDTLLADPHRRTTYGAVWAVKMERKGNTFKGINSKSPLFPALKIIKSRHIGM